MSSNDYLQYADDTARIIVVSMNGIGRVSQLGALTQEACEKYLKDLIVKVAGTIDFMEVKSVELALHSRNLHSLVRTVERDLNIQVPRSLKSDLYSVDGFYFSTRYPGEDNFELFDDDFDMCLQTLMDCRKFVLSKELELGILTNDVFLELCSNDLASKFQELSTVNIHSRDNGPDISDSF